MDEDLPTSSAYYTISELNDIDTKADSLSAFHLNTASLSFHFDTVTNILSNCNVKFDFIAISEMRAIKGVVPVHNTDISDYNFVDCPTEASKGGARLYVSHKHDFLTRNDLQIYKPKELESVFVEILCKNSKNLIVGCVYRHPCTSISEFNDEYLNPLLNNLSNEKKGLILMGDFNINLLNYENCSNVNDFLNAIHSHSLIPHILKPTRITAKTKTLIDNIFTNFTENTHLSGNLTYSVSDQLPQFTILETKAECKKNEPKYVRSFKNFDKNDFLTDFLTIDWHDKNILPAQEPNSCVKKLIDTVMELVDRRVPIVKINQKQNNTRHKPWLTTGLIKSISHKQTIYKKFLKQKNKERKTILFNQYKTYRNVLTQALRQCKNNHLKSFFEKHKKDSRKVWQGIRTLISNTSKRLIPHTMNISSEHTSDPKIIANAFNEFFGSIADKTKSKIRKADCKPESFLRDQNAKSIFLSPTTPKEIFRHNPTVK